MIRRAINTLARCRFLYILLFVAISTTVFAQTVSLNVQNKPLSDVLQIITKATDYKFVYSDVLDVKSLVTVKCSNEELGAVLDQIFKGKDIVYKIDGKIVALSPSSVAPVQQDKIQKPIIKGKVTDESGNGIPGVAVQNRRTGNIVASDLDGVYGIEAVSGDQLIFASIGMKEQSVIVGKSDVVNVSLSLDIVALDDVVVTGYQTISKERSTGAFAKVTTEKMAVKRLNSLSSVLEGEIPGYNNGLIRGVTSMLGNTSPLYVIDGFPVESTQYNDNYGHIKESVPEMNIEDIESITVLKDASATSIYGARASNGVIVIETKKARQNQTRVSFSGTLSVKPYSYYTGNVADAATVVGMEREWAETNANLQNPELAQSHAQNLLDNALYQSGGFRSILNYYAGHISQSEMEQQLSDYASRGYSYIEDIEKYGKRDQFQQQYNLSISKGSDKNSFNASFTYKNNKFEDKYSKDESFGLNIKNTTYIRDWLQLDLGSYVSYGDGVNQTYNLFSPEYQYSIYDSLKNPDGSNFTSYTQDRYSIYDYGTIQTYGLMDMDITPLDELAYNLEKRQNISSRNYIRLNVKFTDWLKYSASFQYEYSRFETTRFGEKSSYKAKELVNNFVDYSGIACLPYGNTYYSDDNTSRNYNFRQQLDFNKTFNEKHNVVALAGMELRDNKLNYESRHWYNYDPEMLSHAEINNELLTSYFFGVWGYGALDPDAQNELRNRYVSLYANAAYSYDDRYILSGSVRWDRSNLWSTDSKYQNKPAWSVGLSWNIDREGFMESADWVNMLKLRASYGIGGNVAKDAAPYMTVYYYQNYNFGGLQGTVLGRPNPDLSWEITKTLNVGVDFSFLNNRLNGSLDYYHKRGLDLLANANGVPTEGFGYFTYAVNNGEMTNEGFELSLNGVLVDTKDWMLSVGGMLSYNKNEVKYVNVEATQYYQMLQTPQSYPRIGKPYNAIYGYNWAGLSNTGLPQVYTAEGEKITTQPKDLASVVYLGTYTPKYFGSFNVNLKYRNWSLNALMTYEGGHKIQNTYLPCPDGTDKSGGGDFAGLLNSRYADRWMKPGDELITDVPKMLSPDSPDYNSNSFIIYAASSINVLDATNWRMKNLSLSYELSKKLCSKIGLYGMRVQLMGENIFTLAKSKEAKYMLNGYDNAIYSLGLQINL